jgi:hypothetical protein
MIRVIADPASFVVVGATMTKECDGCANHYIRDERARASIRGERARASIRDERARASIRGERAQAGRRG